MNSINNITYFSFGAAEGKQKDCLLQYTGTIDYQSINSILRRVADSYYVKGSIKKKMLEIITELLQNILHHGCNTIGVIPSFEIEKRKKGFVITASNLIDENAQASLKKRIEEINSYSAKELENHYRHVLKNASLNSENTGLGLMSIVRKSGNGILFKFVRQPALKYAKAGEGNNYYLFTVKVLV